MAIKNAQGNIVARAILRLLWDEKQQRPVLFREGIYTNALDSQLSIMLTKACIQRAKELQVELLAFGDEREGKPYAGRVSSFGSPVPYEYSDAADERAIAQKGIFTISRSRLLYSPHG